MVSTALSSTPSDQAAPDSIQRLPIEFTGSGSEYFRIWIVNMVLLVITLGLYWPWAKVRRLRYFWGNTLVDGDPLGFHGEAGQMFKGWVLVGVLFIVYNVAESVSPVAGAVAFAALGSLWPALWRSSMVFRLGNTSWRGLRFRFVGPMKGAYLALLPLFLAALLPVFLLAWLPEEPDEPFQAWMGWTFGGFVILLVGVLPWVLWRMKAYQHRHYALGPLQTDFRAGLGAFYGLALKPLVLLLVVAGLVGLMAGWRSGDVLPMALGGFLAFFPFVLLLLVLAVVPWWKARLQNLVWTKTGNAQIRFISRLSFRSMLWLTIKNWVLVAITLGLYWPFAAVAMARLRLEAIHLRSVVDLENLLALDQQRPEEAAGEAAGDFFGLDVGI
jgi:uncharacterized membrane protein YjgN (DUF898 family)